MNYIFSSIKPNVTSPSETTMTVLFGDKNSQQEITFIAKETLSDIKIQMRRAATFTDEEINNYASKIKQSLNQWNEAADYPSTYKPIA